VPKPSTHHPEYVRRGAEVRFRELLHELGKLTAAFPHLQDTIDEDELPIRFVLAHGAPKTTRRRRPAAAGRKKR